MSKFLNAKTLNWFLSSLAVLVGSLQASGLIEDPKIIKALGVGGMLLAAGGFQRKTPAQGGLLVNFDQSQVPDKK